MQFIQLANYAATSNANLSMQSLLADNLYY